MKAIACVTKNNGLGYKNQLIVKSKADMDFFRQTTMGKIVVMGRKTFESIGGKPLKGRTNIVISSKKIDNANVIQYYDLVSFLNSEYNTDDTFVIGGAQIYKFFLPYLNCIYLTEAEVETEADVFFPDITKDFVKKSCRTCIDENGTVLNFCEYVRC